MTTTDLLRELVAIDSVSARSNAPMLDLIEPYARSLGFTIERQPLGADKWNLICRRGPMREGMTEGNAGLALVGHTDTVPYDADWREALTLTEREGKLYGRGACDTKGFIACALAAAARAPATLAAPLWLVFTADEEVGCHGAKALEKHGAFRPRHAIVGEPTELRPIRAGKGYCFAEVSVRGEEAHSAYPDRGASALRGARLFLDELDLVEEHLRQDSADGAALGFVPPFTTLNVGQLTAGKAKNIVPGEARFSLEWRPVPGPSAAKLRTALAVIAASVRRRLPRLEVHVNVLREDAGFATDPRAALVRFLEAQSGNTSGTVPFGTEAPSLVHLGAEPVVFGPGDIRVAHSTGEFVPVEDLKKCEDILVAAIERFAG